MSYFCGSGIWGKVPSIGHSDQQKAIGTWYVEIGTSDSCFLAVMSYIGNIIKLHITNSAFYLLLIKILENKF